MRYEWDEAKQQANLEKHGLDFLDAPLVLEAEERAVFPAGYEQEERFKAIARVGKTYLVVVYTERSTATRIISFSAPLTAVNAGNMKMSDNIVSYNSELAAMRNGRAAPTGSGSKP